MPGTTALFYSLFELISPDRQTVQLYQSCGPGEELMDACGRVYTEFLPIDHPIGFGSDMDAAVKVDITLPIGNNREVSTLSTDWLVANNFLKQWVLRVIQRRFDDPNWVLGPIPYVISYGDITDQSIKFTLQSPTVLAQTGNLVQLFTSEQYPRQELPFSAGY